MFLNLKNRLVLFKKRVEKAFGVCNNDCAERWGVFADTKKVGIETEKPANVRKKHSENRLWFYDDRKENVGIAG